VNVTKLESAAVPQHVRCDSCGLLNRDAASFCAGCGRPIDSFRAELEPDQPATVGGASLPPPPPPDQRQGTASSATALPPPPTALPSPGTVDVGLPPPPPPGGLPPPPAAAPAAGAAPPPAADADDVTTPPGTGPEAPPAPGEHEPPRVETTGSVGQPRLRPGERLPLHRKRYVYASIALGVALLAVAAIVLYPRPDVVATSFTMPDVALSGEDVMVSVQLANEGRSAGEHTITVLVDGKPAQSATTNLEAGSDEVVDVAISDLAPGTHELALADWDGFGGVLWVMTPPVFELPDSVVSGEDVVVSVLVTNEGPGTVAQELTLVAQGQDSTVTGDPQATSLELAGGAEQSVRFVFPALAPDDYELTATIGDWEGQAGDVWVMTPARFEVDAIDVQPSPMDINDSQEATVTTSITNAGEADGTYQLRLELDGELIEERSIDLRGGTSTEETFPVTVTEAGTHELVAGDATVSFEAYQLERPANGTLLTNQIGGGGNELRITNNFDEDYLVVLARPGEGNPALLSVYVRGGASHTVYGIRDGTYSTYYAYGSAWCSHHQAFTQGAGYGRYEDDDTFTSSSTSYTWVALTFGITEGPGSPTGWVSEAEFPTM
jgi:hypothetical protein